MRRTLAFDKGDKRGSPPYYAGMFPSKTVSLFLRSHCKVKQTEFKNKYCSAVIGCPLLISFLSGVLCHNCCGTFGIMHEGCHQNNSPAYGQGEPQ